MQFLRNAAALVSEHLTLLYFSQFMMQCLQVGRKLAQFLVTPLQFGSPFSHFAFQIGGMLLHSPALTCYQSRIVDSHGCLGTQGFDQFDMTRAKAIGARITDQKGTEDSPFPCAHLHAKEAAYRYMPTRHT